MNITLSNILLLFLIITFTFSGSYFVLNELAAEAAYNVSVTTYESQFDYTSGISNNITQIHERIKNYDSLASLFLPLVSDVYSTAKAVLSLPIEFTYDLSANLSGIIGLPVWVTDFITVAVIIIILFSFLALILRWVT